MTIELEGERLKYVRRALKQRRARLLLNFATTELPPTMSAYADELRRESDELQKIIEQLETS